MPSAIDVVTSLPLRGVLHRWEMLESSGFAPATDAMLRRVHTPAYLRFLTTLASQVSQSGAAVAFTPRVQETVIHEEKAKIKKDEGSDTIFTQGTMPAAKLAAGAAVHAVDKVLSGEHRNAFCVVRPPGHHAGVNGLLEDAVSCGFCILNNVCVAALHAMESERWGGKVKKVAIVDFDVHHGNGTEEVIRQRIKDPKKLFFASMHLYDKDPANEWIFYPGSGERDLLQHNIINVAMQPLWRQRQSAKKKVREIS